MIAVATRAGGTTQSRKRGWFLVLNCELIDFLATLAESQLTQTTAEQSALIVTDSYS